MMLTPNPVRFSAGPLRRINRYAKVVEKQEARQAKAAKVSRKQRLAQQRIQHRQERLAYNQKYQAALQAYMDDPTPTYQLLNRTVFEDKNGPFTGKDLLKAVKAELRLEKIDNRMVQGIFTMLVVPIAVGYLKTVWKEGHHNPYKFVGMDRDYLADRFPAGMRPAVKQMLNELDQAGLIKQSPDKTLIFEVTALGKQLMARSELY